MEKKDTTSHYILNLLLSQGKAFLPSIGMLELQHRSAHIITENKSISPPYQSIVFHPSDRVTKAHLFDQISSWRDVDEKSAENIATKIENELRENLIKGNIEISGVGILKNTETGIIFTEQIDDNSVFKPYPELPLILKEVTVSDKITATKQLFQKKSEKSEHHDEELASSTTLPYSTSKLDHNENSEQLSENTHYSRSEKVRYNYLKLILVTLVILALFFCLAYFIWSNLASSNKDNTDSQNLEYVENGHIDSNKISSVQSEIFKESHHLPTEKERTNNGISDSNEENVPASDRASTEGVSEKHEEKSKVSIYTFNRRTEEAISDAKAIKDGKCVIIVGAFSQQSNVNELMNKIRTLGYEAYSDRSKRLTRVGVLSECNDSSLRKTLHFCRQKIDSKSWIL